jgi:hypothetical protein
MQTAQVLCFMQTAQVFCFMQTAQVFCFMQTAQVFHLAIRLLMNARASPKPAFAERGHGVADERTSIGLNARAIRVNHLHAPPRGRGG